MDALHSCFPSTISTRKNLIPNTRKSQPPKSTSSPSLLLARARKDHDCHDDIAPSTGAKRCAMILKTLDDFINNYLEPPPLRPSVDPRLVLSDNYAPVTEELPPTECELIQGPLPPCLDGVYIRNGPNPQYLPQGQPYHHFEGDGMLHSVKISQGRATLCSRYVKTYKYTTERKTGYPFFPSIFSSFNGLLASTMRAGLFASQIITGQLNPANGFGVANTSLALFGNRLYALCEVDLPYAVSLTSNGDIQTLGRCDFNEKLSVSMTAHPKIDPETGETFAFRFSAVRPFLTYFHFDADGTKHPDVPIFSMRRPSIIHDFAITKKYAVFVDIQITLDPIKVITTGGSPVVFDPSKVPRIGVLPRYAVDESEIRWFDVPGFNILHTINAWEDEEDTDTIVLVAPNVLSAQNIIERLDLFRSSVEKVRINLKTGIVMRLPISIRNVELGVINQAYVGKKNKFVYGSVAEESMLPDHDSIPKCAELVKLDLDVSSNRDGRTVASRMYGPNCYGGEPFFVAREPENPNAEEDDGYLVSFVHDEKTGESRFLAMDAKSAQLDIVAVLKLPRRVPYGFHGLFVKEKDLQNM
ncbi:hypothetical protein C1H46_039653 [Malus baccata]|uniref:Carotenoid cleavage dioxygenase 4 n=1 Tax=Malus baccata TaxID=106549 RepID=A0A540KKS4_MALBA|nr:hypothetical protein C1H46_039653 [Malus baccata]